MCLLGVDHNGADVVFYDVGGQHSKGREHVWRLRDKHAGNLHAIASSHAWRGPAPPKAASMNWRGSEPLSTEMTRIAASILAFTMRIIPHAASSGLVPRRPAMLSTALRA